MPRFLLTLLLGLALLPVAAQVPETTTNATPTSAAPAAPAPIQPLAAAVLNFQSSDEAMNKQGAELATLLEVALSTSDHVITVERQEVDKILSEQELGKSGLVKADTAAKIGELTGAQVLVTGRLFAAGNQYMAVAKIISTETSRVYGVTATVADLGSLAQAAQELSGKIDAVLVSHRDVLVAVVETPEQRLARLRELLGQRPLPSVSVAITERDYGTPATIDPAAETEMRKELLELGFTVIDSGPGKKKADIAITGEGFSELGSRHGNLVSSRARIEVKAVRTSDGKLLWTDRETEVAVDLGDHTAGKSALQNAAQKLTERLLPKLTK